MIENITAEDFSNEAQFTRDASDVTVVLLEGDTDRRFFRHFIDESQATIIVTKGKGNATDVIQLLDASGFKGAVAIVDADFDHLEHYAPVSANILLTDFHDVEIMLLFSTAFAKLVDEYGSKSKIEKWLETGECADLAGAILESAKPMALLRLLNARRRGNLDFDGVRMEKFLDKNTLQMDTKKMVRYIVNNTRNCGFVDAELVEWIEGQTASEWDCKQLCCGHDVIQIISFGLKRVLGSCSKEVSDVANLESVLRMAYGKADLRKSLLFRKARTWARRNRPFKVFSA